MQTSTEITFEPGSFRDRASRVFYFNGAVFRGLSEAALRDWQALIQTAYFERFRRDGTLVATEPADLGSLARADGARGWAGVLKHETIPFVSYPYEWSFAMLRNAALLQLDLLLAALDEGMILKDGSAFNVQWRGTQPVFIDTASLTQMADGQLWDGYLQFCRTMLYPLLLQAYKDVDFQPWLRGQIDGIEPHDMAAVMSWRDLLRPGVFPHVYLQGKLQARYADRCDDVGAAGLGDAAARAGLVRANARRLRCLIESLRWRRQSSAWSGYTQRAHYGDVDLEQKRRFVAKAAATCRWKLVWDLGCNDGAFSRLVLDQADYVVACDSDHLAVDRLYRDLAGEGERKILPLVINLADPPPNLGWRGAERRDLRARGRPDLVLCLALIHHMVIGSNIRLEDFLDWLAGLGGAVVIEFVDRSDPMVQTLLRNRADIFSDYDRVQFEACLQRKFTVLDRSALPGGTRELYFAAPLSS